MKEIGTGRIIISELNVQHSAFILELVNSSGWKEFIGERNVNSLQDAEIYIHNILANENIKYHVISIRSENIPIGIVTFIKRDSLEHHDIGFAFLPQYSGNGYAFEATKVMLENYTKDHPVILATTKIHNNSSIKLLEKLGFKLDHEMDAGGENPLLLFQFDSNPLLEID